MIRANEIKKFRLRESPAIIVNRVNGEGSSTTVDLLIVDLVMTEAGQRKSEEAEPFAGRRGPTLRFERRLSGRNKEEPQELQLLARSLCDEQMADVNGIKRTAEKAEALGRCRRHSLVQACLFMRRVSVHSVTVAKQKVLAAEMCPR